MLKRIRCANAAKYAARSKSEQLFAHYKASMGMIIRTIGLERTTAVIALAIIACNMTRLRWLDSRAALV